MTNRPASQVLLRWAIQQGCCIAPGSSNPGHIESNAQVFDWSLADSEMLLLNSIGGGGGSGAGAGKRFGWLEDPSLVDTPHREWGDSW